MGLHAWAPGFIALQHGRLSIPRYQAIKANVIKRLINVDFFQASVVIDAAAHMMVATP
jgi:hypothetical protein